MLQDQLQEGGRLGRRGAIGRGEGHQEGPHEVGQQGGLQALPYDLKPGGGVLRPSCGRGGG